MKPPRVLAPGPALRRAFFAMRPEEAIAVLFLLPTTWLTVVAHYFAPESGVVGPRFAGGVIRIGVAFVCAATLYLSARRKPAHGTPLFVLREMLPFLLCILIYTNLHDTIGFVNPNDIHQYLIDLDIWLFGVEPCLWAEQFYTRARTEIFQLFYMSFSILAPAVPLVLLAQKRFADFRRAALSIILCFYVGYVLYLLFPAAPPRIVLASEFKKNLGGDPLFASMAANSALSLLPTDSRAAFPSLHAAVSLLSLGLAWRFTRGLFAALLPLVLGLWVSTIYLRHHYVVDLFAGFLLAPLAYGLAPRLDAWWQRQRERGL
ncbi:MAG: inositol phosphorylceramide synthase [Vicinamibacteria bacterium]|nr:inositol phosphorylceramide synthase [Vicinamibacteria bacterium]